MCSTEISGGSDKLDATPTMTHFNDEFASISSTSGPADGSFTISDPEEEHFTNATSNRDLAHAIVSVMLRGRRGLLYTTYDPYRKRDPVHPKIYGSARKQTSVPYATAALSNPLESSSVTCVPVVSAPAPMGLNYFSHAN